MELAFVGLGRMGAPMARRLAGAGHRVIGYDRDPQALESLAADGIAAASSLAEAAQRLTPPRTVWLMVPAGAPVQEAIEGLLPHLSADDTLIDGGNSFYRDSLERAATLRARGIHFLDVGTSGGLGGSEAGYCLMVGGEASPFQRCEPLFQALSAPHGGYAHVGPSGAGHFAKMVHNAIEYALMEAYAEGFELLKAKAEFPFDLHRVAALWQQGSVIRSWLLELLGRALRDDQDLSSVAGYVEDTGEGRWAAQESIELAVPAPALVLALQARFRSRQTESFAAKLLAALRREIGGHPVIPSADERGVRG